MPQVTTTKLVEGASHVVIRVDLFNNDGTGELTNLVVFTGAMCNPVIPIPMNPTIPTFRLMQAWYGMVWFDVTVGTGTLQPNQLWTFARDTNSHTDFRSFGGLVDVGVYDNPSVQSPAGQAPDDDNGQLWLSTNGFGVLGAQGSLVLELRKLGITNL